MGYREPDRYDFGLGWDDEVKPEPTIRTRFADQFEQDTHGPIFYRGGTGRPVRVTDEERTRAVERWDRASRYIVYPVGGAMVALLVWAFSRQNMMESLPAIGISFASIVIVEVLVSTWLSRRLTRQFLARTPCGAPRTVWANLSRRSDQVTWKEIGLFGLGVMALTAVQTTDDSGMALLVLITKALGAAVFIVLAAVKLLRWWSNRWGARRIGYP